MTAITSTSEPEQPAAPGPPLVELRAALAGTLVLPGDATWDDARAPWVRGIDQQPVAVAAAASVADVVATVRFAARHGLAVAAQPRGHGATGRLANAILLRTGALDSIEVDVSGRTARVGAGVAWGSLLSALDGTGLIALPGSNPLVSVVGFCLGGGLSWFGRAFGTGARAVRAAEVADASGELRWVTADSDPELLWALRGGGGDFAVVTAVEIDLFEAPDLYGGRLVFPGTAARAVFAAFADVTRSAPDELTLWASVMHVPDAPPFPAELRGQSLAIVDVMGVGTAHTIEALIAPVRAAGEVVRETVRALRPSDVGGVAEEPTEMSTPGLGEALALSTLDDAAIERLLDVAGPGSGTALLMVQVRHLDGVLSEATTIAGAAVRVEAPYLVNSLGVLADPALEPALRAGIDAVRDALRPLVTPELVLTFVGAHGSITDAFGAATVERLRAVKHSVDPSGVFRSNYPVLDERPVLATAPARAARP